MKVNKKYFCEALKLAEKQDQFDSDFNESMKTFNAVEEGFFYNDDSIFSALLYALADNEEEKDWISWFMFESNFGHGSCNKAWIKDIEYTISSPEDLYDFLKTIDHE